MNPEADWDDPADDAVNMDWARRLIKALEPHTVGNYLNFPGLLEEGELQLRASFGPHYERLIEVKDEVGPGQPVPHQSQRAAAACGKGGG